MNVNAEKDHRRVHHCEKQIGGLLCQSWKIMEQRGTKLRLGKSVGGIAHIGTNHIRAGSDNDGQYAKESLKSTVISSNL